MERKGFRAQGSIFDKTFSTHYLSELEEVEDDPDPVKKLIRQQFQTLPFLFLFGWKENGINRVQAVWESEEGLVKFTCMELGLDPSLATNITSTMAYSMIIEKRQAWYGKVLYSANEAIDFFCSQKEQEALQTTRIREALYKNFLNSCKEPCYS